MAIYHCSVKMIGRSDGRSSVASAAYRSGTTITNEQDGITHNYENKAVAYSAIFAPANAGEWAKDRSLLWNKVEASEKRKDAQTAREIEVALPHELNREQQMVLLSDFVQSELVYHGMIVDVNIHANDGNEHAHLQCTTRDCDQDGFLKKNRNWNSKDFLQNIRDRWADYCNSALERAGLEVRISSKSNADRGVEDLPTVHEGYFARKLEKRGEVSELCQKNRDIRKINEERKEIQEKLDQHEKNDSIELDSLQREHNSTIRGMAEQLISLHDKEIQRLENVNRTGEEYNRKMGETIAKDTAKIDEWNKGDIKRYMSEQGAGFFGTISAFANKAINWINEDEIKQREKRIESNKATIEKNKKAMKYNLGQIEEVKAYKEQDKERYFSEYAEVKRREKARQRVIEEEEKRKEAKQRKQAELEAKQQAEKREEQQRRDALERERLSKLSRTALEDEIRQQGYLSTKLQNERLIELLKGEKEQNANSRVGTKEQTGFRR